MWVGIYIKVNENSARATFDRKKEAQWEINVCKSCQIHSWRVFLHNKHISSNRHACFPSQLASLQLVGTSDRSGFVISAEDCQEGHKSELIPFFRGCHRACLLGAERDPLAGLRAWPPNRIQPAFLQLHTQTPCNNTFRLTFILDSQRQSVALWD